MRTLFHVVLLLVFSGILRGEVFPQNPQTQDEAERRMLFKGFSVEPRHGKGNQTEDARFVKCLICKRILKSAIKRVERKLGKLRHKVCLSFLPKFRPTCNSKGNMLQGFLIKAIFPGREGGTCWRMGIC
ncbi:hypothetical protein KOW79_008616 [Hemibagrus wyckioides]|uniref:Uncharacterized protein n=1 Tax=Hemibagrus wyckioides TaxID=337641 RepID=A0A9D3SLP6_9TELE|nr:hypothetical protein KOW79_008616 [Hemibagrus wyckioides]